MRPFACCRIQEIAQNPAKMNEHMQDERIMAALSVMMGMGGPGGPGDAAAEPAAPAPAPPPAPEPAPPPKELTEEEKREYEVKAEEDKDRYLKECEEAGVEPELPKEKKAKAPKQPVAARVARTLGPRMDFWPRPTCSSRGGRQHN